MDAFKRVKSLIGEKAYQKLKNSSVAVFGIGGVGGYVAEALIRSGIGNITFIDDDVVKESNVNRQIVATNETLGEYKVDVMRSRALSINPKVNVNIEKIFYLPETAEKIDLTSFDYIVDAIDTVSAKITLIERAEKFGVPIISCMGTGGKLNPTMLKVADISQTSVCPLARVMRRELKKRGINRLKVVYSEEIPIVDKNENSEKKASGRNAPPSMIFVPATAGLIVASEVVKDLIKG